MVFGVFAFGWKLLKADTGETVCKLRGFKAVQESLKKLERMIEVIVRCADERKD